MKEWMKKWLSVALCFTLLISTNYPSVYATAAVVEDTPGIDPLLKKSYLALLTLAPTLQFTSQQFQAVRERLKKEERAKKDDLKRKQDDLEKQVRQVQADLKQLNEKAAVETETVKNQRHDLH